MRVCQYGKNNLVVIAANDESDTPAIEFSAKPSVSLYLYLFLEAFSLSRVSHVFRTSVYVMHSNKKAEPEKSVPSGRGSRTASEAYLPSERPRQMCFKRK